MVNDINRSLMALSKQLNRKSLNYTVSMKLWLVESERNLSLDEIVKAAISEECVVANHGPSSIDELISEFTEGASHLGDAGAHPNQRFSNSLEAKQQIHELVKRLSEAFSNCESVRWIGLSEGHPFYPVFWDFGFVIQHNGTSFVFIGSSSD